MVEKRLKYINFLETNNIIVKTFRYNNAGEKEKFKEKLIELGKTIGMEFLALGTPHQNGIVERAFAMMYRRVQTMMNYAKFEGEVRKTLWAECAKIATELDGVLIQEKKNKSNYKKLFGRNPAFLKYLRIFGEIGIIIMVHKQEGHKSKIEDRGKDAIFVRYKYSRWRYFPNF